MLLCNYGYTSDGFRSKNKNSCRLLLLLFAVVVVAVVVFLSLVSGCVSVWQWTQSQLSGQQEKMQKKIQERCKWMKKEKERKKERQREREREKAREYLCVSVRSESVFFPPLFLSEPEYRDSKDRQPDEEQNIQKYRKKTAEKSIARER